VRSVMFCWLMQMASAQRMRGRSGYLSFCKAKWRFMVMSRRRPFTDIGRSSVEGPQA
jgi:hypothetical protein